MTEALEGVSGQQQAPATLYLRERTGTHFTGGWWVTGPVRTGGKSRPHRDSIPDIYTIIIEFHSTICIIIKTFYNEIVRENFY
jgi:hypothetical protein